VKKNLYIDSYIERTPESKTRNKPKKKLSKKQREKILAEKWEYLSNAYANRMFQSGFVNSGEERDDILSEAYVAINCAFDKFDVSVFKGKISPKIDYPGKKGKKTIGWYFTNFFINYINLSTWTPYKTRKAMGEEAVDTNINYDQEVETSVYDYVEATSRAELERFLEDFDDDVQIAFMNKYFGLQKDELTPALARKVKVVEAMLLKVHVYGINPNDFNSKILKERLSVLKPATRKLFNDFWFGTLKKSQSRTIKQRKLLAAVLELGKKIAEESLQRQIDRKSA